MKKIIPSLFVSSLLIAAFSNIATAELVTFEKDYTYQASEIDSKLSSRVIALEQVKRRLLEELGTYLISETEVVNYKLSKDQVSVLTAGIVSTEILQEKWDGTTYYMKAKITADPDHVVKSVNNLRTDKEKTKELEATRKRADNALAEIEKLKKENETLRLSAVKQTGYSKAVKELSAIDWLTKGRDFLFSGNSRDALNAYNMAIELNPEYAEAYGLRGAWYFGSDKQQAIADFSQAIKLNPQYHIAYWFRGKAYANISNDQQAIKDFSKAIELKPKSFYYFSRGTSYVKLEYLPQAIKDFNQSIKLEHSVSEFYEWRGMTYSLLNNYQKSIIDFSKAIELNPNNHNAYYMRGDVYGKLNRYQESIEDFIISARLGNESAQDILRQKGVSW